MTGPSEDTQAFMQRMAAIAEDAMTGRTIEDGDCLIWKGRLSRSSGHPKYGDKVMRRVVWQAKNGPLLPGQFVTVTCGNPKCLEHLAITSKAEIARRTNANPRVKAVKRMKSTIASRKNAKLTVEKARYIRESELDNHSLAQMFGVSHGLISKVRTNNAWVECAVNPFQGLGAR